MLIYITTSNDQIEKVVLQESQSHTIEWIGKPIQKAIDWLSLYFSRKDPRFLPPLDATQFTSPQAKRVLFKLLEIPMGTTLSYKDFANLAGMPGAQRAVGTLLGKNPFPLFLPCHRVTRSDGSLGGFGFGCALKEKILRLENLS